MPEIPVDLTGIQTGETIKWDGAKFIRGAAVLTPKTGANVAALGAGVADGQMGIIRVGAWPNIHEVYLRWNDALDRWIGEEMVNVTQNDAWAMDLSNRTAAQMAAYSPIDNPVPFGKALAYLTADVNLASANFNVGTATGVLNVDDTTSTHSFPFTDAGGAASPVGPYAILRDCFISYTGRTGTTLTGCAVVEGTREVVPAGNPVTQGWSGGWGFVVSPILYADDLFAAGLTLQERLISLMNSAPPRVTPSAVAEKKLTVAPYWHEFDNGDGHEPNAPSHLPLSGGLGTSAILESLAGSGGTFGESSFIVTTNDWSDWPLAAPTKQFLIPTIVGKMEAGFYQSGSILDAKLSTRWVSA